MSTLLAVSVGIAGLFGMLWYRTLTELPASRKPRCVSHPCFKWGIPAAALLLLLASIAVLRTRSKTTMIVFTLLLAAGAVLVRRFDRYSAEMKLIYDRFSKISDANPAMEEIEVLFRVAEWRYPSWGQDRLLELVAGKDVEALMVLMMIHENGINPLSDWHLYRRLKAQAARIAGPGKELERRNRTRGQGSAGAATR